MNSRAGSSPAEGKAKDLEARKIDLHWFVEYFVGATLAEVTPDKRRRATPWPHVE